MDSQVPNLRVSRFPAGEGRDDQVFDGALQGARAEPKIESLARDHRDDLVRPREVDAGHGKAFTHFQLGEFLACDRLDFRERERFEGDDGVQSVEKLRTEKLRDFRFVGRTAVIGEADARWRVRAEIRSQQDDGAAEIRDAAKLVG